MKNYKLKITKVGLILHFAFCIFNCQAITPFYFQMYNEDGSAQTNVVTLQVWPPEANGFSVIGTNIIYGPHIISNLPNSSGYFSNALYANTYAMKIPSVATFSAFAVIPDTTNFQSLALYLTNVPVSPGAGLNSYGLITNLLGFDPAHALNTNDFARATRAGITNSLAFVPANAANTNDFARATEAGITNSLAFIPAHAANTNDFARATRAGITNSLAFVPADAATTNDFARAANTNDFARATPAGVTNSLGFIPANAANTNDFARITANGLSQSIGSRTDVKVITNGAVALLVFKTNNVPGAEFTNQAQGSLLVTTNGGLYRLTNIVWQPIAL